MEMEELITIRSMEPEYSRIVRAFFGKGYCGLVRCPRA